MIIGELPSDPRISPSREGEGGYCDVGPVRNPGVDEEEQQKPWKVLPDNNVQVSHRTALT
jgi:hypothetical protein